MAGIDHEQLLRKYIRHVKLCEGATFIDSYHRGVDFTAEELAELKRLEKEFTI